MRRRQHRQAITRRAALRRALATPPAQFQPALAKFAEEFDIASVARKFASHVEAQLA